MAANQQDCQLTFEKDKLALAVLVHGVYLVRQTPPENVDEHRVSRHDRVISHPPEPVVLKVGQRGHRYVTTSTVRSSV